MGAMGRAVIGIVWKSPEQEAVAVVLMASVSFVCHPPFGLGLSVSVLAPFFNPSTLVEGMICTICFLPWTSLQDRDPWPISGFNLWRFGESCLARRFCRND